MMMSDARLIEFQADLDAFASKLKIGVGNAMKAITNAITEKVVSGTPVDSGRARDNWFVTLDQPSDEYDPHPELKGGEAIAPHEQPDLQIDGTRSVFISNNCPYIVLLEDGHSGQAPAGMAQVAVTAVEERIDNIVKDAF